MQTTKRWFQTATMMAFLAIVALFVSPAFAWDCCCTSEKVVSYQSTQSTLRINAVQVADKGNHSCCAEAMVATKTVANAQRISELKDAAPTCSAIKPICECDKNAPAVFALSDHSSSFQPVLLALIATPYTLSSPVESTRPAVYANVSARPRGPDIRARSSRGPPTSLLS